MCHFYINGSAIKKSDPKKNKRINTKAQIVFAITFGMIASTVSKFGRVVAFSTNARSCAFRPSNLPIPKNYLSFDSLQITTSTSFRKRGLFVSAIDEDEELVDIDRTWDLGGLRKEVSRLTVRCHKKTGKANERLRKAQEEVDRLTSDDDVTMEELEKCPNLDELEAQVEELRTRLTNLNQLEVMLADIKGKKAVLPERIAKLAISLEVNDEPPQRQPRGPKKQKGPKNMNAFRLPYRRFYTIDKTEIRVGKQAQDNDELSIKPEHRDGADWWMHASGCPGSHVVIRCHDQNLNEDVVMDAAALAARQSKCNGAVIKVSMCRARDVKKPPGAKAGLVQLTGQIRTVSVNMKEAQARLDRLDDTVLVN